MAFAEPSELVNGKTRNKVGNESGKARSKMRCVPRHYRRQRDLWRTFDFERMQGEGSSWVEWIT